MKKVLSIIAVLLVVSVAAVQADLSNVRPVPISTPGLQESLNTVTVGTPLVNTTVQSDAAIFTNTATGKSATSFMFEITPLNASPYNAFGIYEYGNSGNKIEIFGSGTPRVDQVLDFKLNGDIFFVGNPNPVGHLTDKRFGFYLDTRGANGGPVTYYSEDSLNSGLAQAVILQGNNTATLQLPGQGPGLFVANEWIIAFDDGRDSDFDDMVVMVESITPAVPAPGALLLGMIGLSLTGYLKKRFA